MAQSAWGWVMANSAQDTDFYDPNAGGYFGGQSTIIGAAIELYLASGVSEYKAYADSHILEAEYRFQNGIYRSTGAAWPVLPPSAITILVFISRATILLPMLLYRLILKCS